MAKSCVALKGVLPSKGAPPYKATNLGKKFGKYGREIILTDKFVLCVAHALACVIQK